MLWKSTSNIPSQNVDFMQCTKLRIIFCIGWWMLKVFVLNWFHLLALIAVPLWIVKMNSYISVQWLSRGMPSCVMWSYHHVLCGHIIMCYVIIPSRVMWSYHHVLCDHTIMRYVIIPSCFMWSYHLVLCGLTIICYVVMQWYLFSNSWYHIQCWCWVIFISYN